ncbi:HlyD family secretion protein [Ammoniphilus sp. YIM 78166]|uniref:HlyD family secretion protein n=1 Tax=Ammoniphilus sp. YIM 78166 TaxID=1644106 RepID=UPI00106F0CE2|nr:efflux RND transporter periplasmic adaptor subunit [Ammoniphilus sp. YIM 78166]
MARWKPWALIICVIGLVGCSSSETDLYSGTIEGVEVPVLTEIGGSLDKIEVEEGQRVKKGDVLAALDPRLLEQQVREAEAHLLSAQAQLEGAKAGTRSRELSKAASQIEQVEAQIRHLQTQQDRFQAAIVQREAMLAQVQAQWKGAVSTLRYQEKRLKDVETLAEQGAEAQERVELQREAVHQASIAVESLQSQVDAHQAQLAIANKEKEALGPQIQSVNAQLKAADAQFGLLQEGVTVHTLKQLEAQKAMAEAKLEQARLQREKAVVVSPVNGVIARRNVSVGEIVKPSYQLFTLFERDRLQLTVYVPENKLNLVQVGQIAEVAVDAYPNQLFKGRVKHIAENAEFTPKNVQTAEERTKMVFAVTLVMEEGLDKLKPGMPADVSWNRGKKP